MIAFVETHRDALDIAGFEDVPELAFEVAFLDVVALAVLLGAKLPKYGLMVRTLIASPLRAASRLHACAIPRCLALLV